MRRRGEENKHVFLPGLPASLWAAGCIPGVHCASAECPSFRECLPMSWMKARVNGGFTSRSKCACAACWETCWRILNMKVRLPLDLSFSLPPSASLYLCPHPPPHVHTHCIQLPICTPHRHRHTRTHAHTHRHTLSPSFDSSSPTNGYD